MVDFSGFGISIGIVLYRLDKHQEVEMMEQHSSLSDRRTRVWKPEDTKHVQEILAIPVFQNSCSQPWLFIIITWGIKRKKIVMTSNSCD